MSNAIYCDHCEKLMSEEYSKKAKIELHRKKEYSPEECNLDLCEECFEKLDSWIFAKYDLKQLTTTEEGKE
jgi:hypothetical protein